MSIQIHHHQIKMIADAFERMQSKAVFVGGAIVSCYADRPIAGLRPTDDIDVIVEVLNYSERIVLEEQLRDAGFKHDITSGIICRYLYEQIVVDIMPIDDPSLNFNNQWYQYGYVNAIEHELDKDDKILILNAPCFIATKLEAFKDRGRSDGRTSSDFEDIVFILENRSTIWDEFEHAEKPLKDYLLAEFQKLAAFTYLPEWIDGHVERGYPPATETIIENIKKFLEGG